MVGGQREAALQELHDRHASELWRFAMRLTRDRQLSEDIVQEVLLKAWKDPSLGQRDEAAARAWLFTASRNLIIDRWRSAASRHEQRMEDPPEESPRRDHVVLDRWLIAEALGSLSMEHRSVINAAYYEGRSVAEISARLRIPEGTVKSRLHYGLRTLRLALQEKGGLGRECNPRQVRAVGCRVCAGRTILATDGSSKSIWPAVPPAGRPSRNWLPSPACWLRSRQRTLRCCRWRTTSTPNRVGAECGRGGCDRSGTAALAAAEDDQDGADAAAPDRGRSRGDCGGGCPRDRREQLVPGCSRWDRTRRIGSPSPSRTLRDHRSR